MSDTTNLMEKFMPHGACFLWKFDILLPYVLGELITAMSYILIPICLAVLLRHKNFGNEATRPVVAIYACFIFVCGLGHVVNIYNIWNGAYRIAAFFSILTATLSLLAAVSTIYLCAIYLSHMLTHKKANELLARSEKKNGDRQSP